MLLRSTEKIMTAFNQLKMSALKLREQHFKTYQRRKKWLRGSAFQKQHSGPFTQSSNLLSHERLINKAY